MAANPVTALAQGRLPIRVVVQNRTTTLYAASETQRELRKFFRYKADAKMLAWSPKYASGEWDGYYCLLRWGRVGTGLFLCQREKIERMLGVLDVTDRRVYPAFREDTGDASGREAWDHQRQAVEQMIQHSNQGGLVQAATGAGKTALAGMYCKRLIGSAVFVVDEKYLSHQSNGALSAVLGEPVGTVGMGLFEPQRITVATIQTLSRRLLDPRFREWFRKLEVVILDEVHLALNKRSLDVVNAIQPKAVFGLTATVQMGDLEVRMKAIELCGRPIFRYGIVQGQQDGILQKGKVYQVPFVNLNSDYVTGVVCDERRNELVREVVMRGLQKDRVIAVLVERRKHLSILSRMFPDVEHEVLSGLVKVEDRADIIERMRQRKVHLLLASRVFFKGVDVPELDMVIDATGVPDPNAAVQRFGRGVRRAEGKRELVYVDISDMGSLHQHSARSRLEAWAKIGIPIERLAAGELPSCE